MSLSSSRQIRRSLLWRLSGFFSSLNTVKIMENIYVHLNQGLIWPNAYDSCHLYVQLERTVLYIENGKMECVVVVFV